MSLKRALGPFDATTVVVGGIIGTGIFVNPYIVARGLDSTPLVLGAWMVGGVVAIALNFARYALRLVDQKETGVAVVLVAAAAIVVLTIINYIGVRPGAHVVNASVVLKLAALVVLIAFAWWGGSVVPNWWSESRPDDTPSHSGPHRARGHGDPGGQCRGAVDGSSA